MQVACLRFGTFGERPEYVQSLSTWLSLDDAARLVDASLRSDTLTYAVVWGVSANTRRTWSLDAARALGYEPHDDAEDWVGVVDDTTHPSDDYVGGGFTSPGFG